jgi:hypothetical protein
MTKSIKNKIELPLTLADVQIELEMMAQEVLTLVKSGTAAITEIVERNFNSSNGCGTCRGRGWIVVWDTMDSMSGCFAEYGSCTNAECTEESRRASGLYPSYNKYDGNRGVSDPVTHHQAYAILVTPYVERHAEISNSIRELAEERTNFRKGDAVVVVKGRKVPIGTQGRVAWISVNTGNVLVKPADSWQNREAAGIWVVASNLEKVRV